MQKRLRSRALAVLSLVFLLAPRTAPPVAAGPGTSGLGMRLPLMSDYDSDSVGTYEYCATSGKGGVVNSPDRVEIAKVVTSGSSTTVSALTAGEEPFANVAVGDELTFVGMGGLPLDTAGNEYRLVTARASADSITVNTAIDIGTTGRTFTYRKRACGTAATDGWFYTGGWQDFTVYVQADQSDAGGGVDVALYCEAFSSASGQTRVFQKTYSSYGDPSGRDAVTVTNYWDRCRLGIRLLTSDPSDAGAAIEKISASVRGRYTVP